jgi:hypothetical protein
VEKRNVPIQKQAGDQQDNQNGGDQHEYGGDSSDIAFFVVLLCLLARHESVM